MRAFGAARPEPKSPNSCSPKSRHTTKNINFYYFYYFYYFFSQVSAIFKVGKKEANLSSLVA